MRFATISYGRLSKLPNRCKTKLHSMEANFMAKRNADMDRAGKNRFCQLVTVKNLIVCALILFAKLHNLWDSAVK